VLLLDEPTRSLDPIAASEFRRFLKGELVGARGTALFFASHTLGEVEEVADRVLVLDFGRVVACDSPSNIGRAAGNASFSEAIARFIGHDPVGGKSKA
jgi:ABC-2 type transport system ATP-binding protein